MIADVIGMKKMNTGKYNQDKLKRLRSIRLFTILAAAFIIIFCFVIGVALVNGNSMYPTVQSGHPVVYFRLHRNYNRGDIVAVKMPSGERLIKRIIALEGDTLDIRDGQVYVNGVAETGSYVNGQTFPADNAGINTIAYPITVGEGMVFVMGDNRMVSVDSRSIGALAESQIQGIVFWIL